MGDYEYGHVKNWEEDKFERFTMIERQIQYVRAVIKKHPKFGIKRLTKILAWKFGKSIVLPVTIKGLRCKYNG